MRYTIILILLPLALNLFAQQISDPVFINPVQKKVMSEPAKIILTYVGSIALEAVGDGLNDSGHKDWGHLCKAFSTATLLVSPFYINYDKSKWYCYVLSYTFLRVGLFDIVYNATRGLPLNTRGTTSFWDKGLGKLNQDNIYFAQGISVIVGIAIPINTLGKRR